MAARDLAWRWWTALRSEGMPLDLRQLESAVSVADALERASRGDRLLASIEGVFAKNERELDLLRRVAARDGVTSGASVRSERMSGRRARRRRRRWLAPAAAFLLALAVIAGWQLPAWLSTTPTLPIKERDPGAVAISVARPPPATPDAGLRADISSAQVRAATPRSDPVSAALVKTALVLMPLLAVAALILWFRGRRPDWARLTFDAAEDRLTNNLPPPDETGLFVGTELRSFAAALKGQADEPSERIDVRRTVEATAAHAGLLQVAWEPRPLESPVHFAIERRSREDHVSELYFRVADKLREHGAEVSASHYRDDLDSRRDENGALVGSSRINPQETKALLVAVGEGDAMFDATATEPSAKRLRPIEAWPRRVLLSVRPVALWGSREEQLGTAAMAVAPASRRGLRALAERLTARQLLRGVIGVRRRG